MNFHGPTISDTKRNFHLTPRTQIIKSKQEQERAERDKLTRVSIIDALYTTAFDWNAVFVV
jgi:hypothetical protein